MKKIFVYKSIYFKNICKKMKETTKISTHKWKRQVYVEIFFLNKGTKKLNKIPKVTMKD